VSGQKVTIKLEVESKKLKVAWWIHPDGTFIF